MPRLDDTEKIIWNHFRIKQGDILPFTGWAGDRITLAKAMGEIGYKIGAEIGVRHGWYSKVLCKEIPDLKLFCVDPYTVFSRSSQETLNNQYEQAKTRLAPYHVTFIRKRSMQAVEDFEDGSLDFVYIDALHEFIPVMLDLIHWSKKVRIGGIIAGHDYFNLYQMGVVPAVNAFTMGNNVNPWYVTRFDLEPSYFWIKRFEYYGSDLI
jgi:hypothetical protein